MTETILKRTDEDFINDLYVCAARDSGPDRAMFARLRRSFTHDGVNFNALRDLGDLLPGDKEGRFFDLEDYLLVACLFAIQPQSGGGRSLGKALNKLRNKLAVGAESLDRRFVAVLDSDHTDLPYRLRQIIQLLKSNEVPVNYRSLLADLKAWDHPDRIVQRRWATDYWITSK
jgi:CRISPR system Cascade subunit CasB